MTAVLALPGGEVELVGRTAPAGSRPGSSSSGRWRPRTPTTRSRWRRPSCRPPAGSGTAFVEVARRHGDYAVCGVAAVVTVDADLAVTGARVPNLGRPRSGGGRPRPAIVAAGGSADWAGAAELARRGVDPDTDIHASADYRRLLAGVLTDRAVRQAHDDARTRRTGCRGGGARHERPRRRHPGGQRGSPRATCRRAGCCPTRCGTTCGLTGTHVGCEHGVCGACTVLRRRRAGAVLPAARGQPSTAPRHHRRGAAARPTAGWIRCSRRSASATRCSAASARRGSSRRSPRTSTTTPTRPGRRPARRSAATSAAAPATSEHRRRRAAGRRAATGGECRMTTSWSASRSRGSRTPGWSPARAATSTTSATTRSRPRSCAARTRTPGSSTSTSPARSTSRGSSRSTPTRTCADRDHGPVAEPLPVLIPHPSLTPAAPATRWPTAR